MQDRLEAEKAAAAERARKVEASSKALHEQQAQTGRALASVQKQIEDMPSKPAVDPKIEEELTRLRKQVRSSKICLSPLMDSPALDSTVEGSGADCILDARGSLRNQLVLCGMHLMKAICLACKAR